LSQGFKGGKIFIKVIAFHFEPFELVLGSFAFSIVGEGFLELLFKFMPNIGSSRNYAWIVCNQLHPFISYIDPSFTFGSFQE